VTVNEGAVPSIPIYFNDMKQCRVCKKFYTYEHLELHSVYKGVKRYKRLCKECARLQARIKHRQISEYIDSFKVSCKVCGEVEKCCLDFHHLYNKEVEISQLKTYKNQNKIAKLLESELAKCVVLCANCHRKVHAGIIEI
jgi:hypothetical protein